LTDFQSSRIPSITILHRLPYLFDCKPWLIKFFFINSCGLSRAAYHFYFFTSLKGRPIDDDQFFFGYVLLTKLSFRILFLLSITCALVTGAILGHYGNVSLRSSPCNSFEQLLESVSYLYSLVMSTSFVSDCAMFTCRL